MIPSTKKEITLKKTAYYYQSWIHISEICQIFTWTERMKYNTDNDHERLFCIHKTIRGESSQFVTPCTKKFTLEKTVLSILNSVQNLPQLYMNWKNEI